MTGEEAMILLEFIGSVSKLVVYLLVGIALGSWLAR